MENAGAVSFRGRVMQKLPNIIRNAVLLFLLWLLLSGRNETFFILLGLLSSIAISWLHSRQPGPPNPTIPFFRFMLYLPWLLHRILLSNFHTAYLILHPRMPISPRVIRYRTGLRHPAAVGLLANSVTLTPGTLTAEVNATELLVHALDEASAEDLTGETLEKKIAGIFEKKGAA